MLIHRAIVTPFSHNQQQTYTLLDIPCHCYSLNYICRFHSSVLFFFFSFQSAPAAFHPSLGQDRWPACAEPMLGPRSISSCFAPLLPVPAPALARHDRRHAQFMLMHSLVTRCGPSRRTTPSVRPIHAARKLSRSAAAAAQTDRADEMVPSARAPTGSLASQP